MSDTVQPFSTPAQWQTAYQRNDPRTHGFYASACYQWPDDRISEPFTGDEINSWKEWLKDHGARDEQLRTLDKLSEKETRVVITGQQAGAGLGPLYVLYKAFAAIHWARSYEEEKGVACIPLFWVASDDHDLEEVSSVTWLDENSELMTLPLVEDDNEDHQSVFEHELDTAQQNRLFELLNDFVPDKSTQKELFQLIQKSFNDTYRNFESHFVALFCRLLLPLGIIPVAPRLNFMRERSKQVIAREIEQPLKSTESVLRAGEKIQELGVTPLLHRHGNEINFFYHLGKKRCKVVYQNETFEVIDPVSGDVAQEFTKKEFLEELEINPEAFSPNAMLRPIVQDAILPAVAYIGGPGEILYHAQLGELYAQFEVPRPALFPRPNLMLLDTPVVRSMKKLDIDTKDLLKGGVSGLDERLDNLVKELDVYKAFEGKRTNLEGSLEELRKMIEDTSNDTAVRRTLEKLSRYLTRGGEMLEGYLRSDLANRDDTIQRHGTRLKNSLFPNGTPQERTLTSALFLLLAHEEISLRSLQESIDYTHSGYQAIELASGTRTTV